jgi:hypothetical protein
MGIEHAAPLSPNLPAPRDAAGSCAAASLKPATAKHLAATARTLAWADEAAERGDYAGALA